jgi:hypothetical protein
VSRILLRNSERSSFKTCRFRWALTFGGVWEVGPLQSREPAKALWFGDLVHQGLAAYYLPGSKRGPLPFKTFLKLYDADPRLSAVLRNDEGEWESMRDLGAGMLKAYVEEFSERDSEWEVISSEQTFQLPVPTPDGLPPLTVVGTFDGLWRHRAKRDRVVFKEFKTAASIQTDGLAMDDQASYYWTYGPRWIWKQRILPRKTYPTEILYTFLRKAIRNPDKTYDAEGRVLNKPTKADLLTAFPKLVDESMKLDDMITKIGPERAALAGEPSKSQPPAYFLRQPIYRDAADRQHLHERVLAEFRDMVEVRADPSRVYKNPGPLHSPNCRGCPVRDACELHEAGADWLTMLDASTKPWDPYAAHELAERR